MIFPALYALFSLPVQAGPGDLDLSFDPKPDASVTSIAMMPDGLILIGGIFNNAGNGARGKFARIEPDGEVDTFVPAGANGNTNSITVLENGKILIGGALTSVGGITRNRLARLNADGTLDTAFNPNLSNSVYSVAVQPDGKLVVVGNFMTAGGSSRNFIARLNADGSPDSLNPNANDITRTVVLLGDGRMVAGGNFTTMGGVTRNHLVRLSSSGTVDASFAPSVNGVVYSAALQPDGKIIIGGTFTSVAGVARTNIARIDAAGVPDPAFQASTDNIVRSISLQTDGKIVIAGNFTSVNEATSGRLARLNPNGTLDSPFNRTGTNDVIAALALDSSGRILAGGDFTVAGGISRSYFARFENDPAVQVLTLRGNDRVVWKRTGSSPETHRVTFELAAEGDTWTPLGTGTRIAEGWELTGLNLPAGAVVRARARVVSGIYNGSSGLMEATTWPLGSRENWRMVHFGSAINEGDAEDSADPDGDGLTNFTEFAFNLNPKAPDIGSLPEWKREGNDLVLRFSRPPGVGGVEYFAEFNSSLDPEGWQALTNTAGEDGNFTFTAPSNNPGRIFLRFRVGVP